MKAGKDAFVRYNQLVVDGVSHVYDYKTGQPVAVTKQEFGRGSRSFDSQRKKLTLVHRNNTNLYTENEQLNSSADRDFSKRVDGDIAYNSTSKDITYLKIGTLNIKLSKYEGDPHLQTFIFQFDPIGQCETSGDENTYFSKFADGYFSFSDSRTRKKNAHSGSGDVTVFVKEYCQKNLT